jgi:hypothetical protein
MSQPLSPREWEDREAEKQAYDDEQARRARHMPVIPEPSPLTVAGLDEMIAHHKEQAMLWRPTSDPGTDHRRWAAWLETLRQAVIAESER